MRVATFAGPPSSGKTSVILRLLDQLEGTGRVGVVKFDCLTSRDADRYERSGIEVQTGVSGAICPDHFFASNIGACMAWGRRQGFDLLVSESAGLCNRCSPYLREATAVCVIDVLAGVDAPSKVGPMLRLADIVAVTKGDLVSQAEREVFGLGVERANPRARVVFVNGLTGQGIAALAQAVQEELDKHEGEPERLRFSMPGAVCSFCFGDTKIGEKYASGNIKYMRFPDLDEGPHAAVSAVSKTPPSDGPARTSLTGRAAQAPVAAKVSWQKLGMDLVDIPFGQLLTDHPACAGFFDEVGLACPSDVQTFRELVGTLDEFRLSDCGMSASALLEAFAGYIDHTEGLADRAKDQVGEVRILGGTDKDGQAEQLDVTVRAGEVACIVGPTGSGKSRLLEDIEYLAQGDTPTGRRVLLDGDAPGPDVRRSIENRLVAQLSQSMVFIMDLPVCDFLRMHAECRMLGPRESSERVKQAIACANGLAGEPFAPDTLLTQLSGGQSRALMIADLALISAAPIVLVDEIENAGVDRRRALDLLAGSDKIVLAVTHDPLIALSGDLRLVVANGAVRSVIRPSKAERSNAELLRAFDGRIADLRRQVRAGGRIDFDVGAFLGRP